MKVCTDELRRMGFARRAAAAIRRCGRSSRRRASPASSSSSSTHFPPARYPSPELEFRRAERYYVPCRAVDAEEPRGGRERVRGPSCRSSTDSMSATRCARRRSRCASLTDVAELGAATTAALKRIVACASTTAARRSRRRSTRPELEQTTSSIRGAAIERRRRARRSSADAERPARGDAASRCARRSKRCGRSRRASSATRARWCAAAPSRDEKSE